MEQVIKRNIYKIHLLLLSLAFIIFPVVFLTGCLLLINDKNFYVRDQISTFDLVEGEINNLIDIDGYYSLSSERYLYSTVWDGNGIIFYNDGSCSTLEWKEDPPVHLNIPNIDLSKHLKEYEQRILPFIYKGHHYDLCGGLYTINGDTIIAEFVDNGYFIKELYRIYFKVINRTTLEKICYHRINKDSIWVIPSENDSIYRVVSFVPCKNLPSPINMYNKHKKYRWNNKEKWKEYNKQRKEYLKMRRKRN